MRKPFWIVASVIFADTLFYSAIAPLLPEYAQRFAFSDSMAGVLVGSYAIANLLVALPSSGLVARIGIRPALVAGLCLLAGSCLLFGFAPNAEVLVGARFVQGVGGALAWTAGIAWISADAGPSKRGAAIGGVVSAAVIGIIVGPAVGALAASVGTGVVFSLVAALSLLLAGWCAAVPTPKPVGTRLREILGRGRGALWLAVWLVTLPALLSGFLEVVLPLELDELGATALAIGAIFTASAAVEALISPLVGHASDRYGRLTPLRIGLFATTILVALLGLANSVPTVAIALTLVFLALQLFWTPGMALVADLSDYYGFGQSITGALTNLAWAGGAAVGSLAGGGLAEAVGRGASWIVLVAITGATAVFVFSRRRVLTGNVSGG